MIKLIKSFKTQITNSILSNRALLLDFDGTLVDYHQSEKNALEKLFSYCHLSKDLFLKAQEYYEYVNSHYWSEFEKKNFTIEEVQRKRFEDLIKKFSIEKDPLDLNEKYLHFLVQSTSIDPQVLTALTYLKKNGIKLIVITNGIHWTQTERIKACGLDKIIDTYYTSESVGFAKPHPKMFLDSKEFLRSVNYPVDNLWVIGDNFEADIKGAFNVGYNTCWISDDKNQNELDLKTDYPTMIANNFMEFFEFYTEVKYKS